MKPTTTALIITGVLSAYLVGGILLNSGKSPNGDGKQAKKAFAVEYRKQNAEEFIRTVTLRGNTEALRHVMLKAELDGRVIETPIEKGNHVKAGDLICRLETREREARVQEAKAILAQRGLERDAAKALIKSGHRSETQYAAALANYDAAVSNVERTKLELEHTYIKAPFDGLIDERAAEVGSFLQKGGLCATLMSENPFLVVAEISEAYVGKLNVGMLANVRTTDGRTFNGKIRYIAGTANSNTRAFRIEIEVPNPKLELRDGLTATIDLEIETIQAQFLPPSVLVLNANGVLGVRAVDQNGNARFYPVQILDDDLQGIWVNGLPNSFDLITVGQNFVVEGESIRKFAQAGAN